MIKRFKRVNYYDGQIMQAEDLLAEQEYFQSKLRLHNRVAIGAGIIEGLAVWQKETKLIIEPGIALDCLGRELVLAEPVEITIEPDDKNDSFVLMEYLETETDPSPSVCPDQVDMEFSRITEGVKVFLGGSTFPADHKPKQGRFEACNHDHPIPIVVIRRGIATGIAEGR